MTTPAEKLKVSDIPPTTLRLPPDLRDVLMREATINGRSLSQEITIRLRGTLDKPDHFAPKSGATVVHTTEHAGKHAAHEAPALSDAQRIMLSLYNALPPEKQLALLTFLRR